VERLARLSPPYTPEVSQGVVRAVISVAAFAGLREGEIRGQWWEDHNGDVLNIRALCWRTHLNDETKTHEDDDDPGVVPIIEPLRVVLEAIKPEIASGWMFPNTIGGALDLDNSGDGRHEATGSKNSSCSSRAAGLGELTASD
jgi:hypothetical protein